jgi:hypothetical protein
MDTLDQRDQQLITRVRLRQWYRERLDDVRGRDSDVDHSIFALFEEGHRFAPASSEAPFREAQRVDCRVHPGNINW